MPQEVYWPIDIDIDMKYLQQDLHIATFLRNFQTAESDWIRVFLRQFFLLKILTVLNCTLFETYMERICKKAKTGKAITDNNSDNRGQGSYCIKTDNGDN